MEIAVINKGMLPFFLLLLFQHAPLFLFDPVWHLDRHATFIYEMVILENGD